MNRVIETSDLVKIYGSGQHGVRALDNVGFTVEGGTITGLLGHNGAGKTTLLNILAGLLLPTSGSASVLGMNVVKDSKKIRRSIGLLPDGFGLYDTDTAEENLRYIAALNDLSGEDRDRRIREALRAVGLDDVENRKFGGFSRGMKQKLGVASILLKDPEVLLLDEPTAGLDPEAAREFKDLMVSLCREHGKTIVLSTHLLHEVAVLCTDITIINRGRIMLSGKVDDLKKELLEKTGYKTILEAKEQDELVRYLKGLNDVQDISLDGSKVIVKSSSDIREEIAEMALARGIKITLIYGIQPSLEDIFMKYYEGGAN